MILLTNWDRKFIQVTNLIASWSKDPRHKVGCVIVDPVNNVRLSEGYNGFPRGVEDDIARLEDKEIKRRIIVHAEANAIANAAKVGMKLDGATLYCTLPPCSQCMGLIIQAGIRRVMHGKDTTSAWRENFSLAEDLAWEVDIEIKMVEGSIYFV